MVRMERVYDFERLQKHWLNFLKLYSHYNAVFLLEITFLINLRKLIKYSFLKNYRIFIVATNHNFVKRRKPLCSTHRQILMKSRTSESQWGYDSAARNYFHGVYSKNNNNNNKKETRIGIIIMNIIIFWTAWLAYCAVVLFGTIPEAFFFFSKRSRNSATLILPWQVVPTILIIFLENYE